MNEQEAIDILTEGIEIMKLTALKPVYMVAIKALEKQIPQKPLPEERENLRYIFSYRCPQCKKAFSGKDVANYCYHCGQKLDWSE